MLEPVPPSRHPVGDHLRKAADLLEKTAVSTAPERWVYPEVRATLSPWVGLMSPNLGCLLAEWLRSAAGDAALFGADVAAVAVADAILGGGR